MSLGKMHLNQEMIERPLEFVKSEYEKDNSITPSHVEKLYLELLANSSELEKIQSLNKSSISELNAEKVVHFRCMVQDMYDSEFFFKVYNIHNKETGDDYLKCGLYQDVIKQDDNEEFTFESPLNNYGDRQVLYCVPIPGENLWTKMAHNSKFCSDVKMDLVDSINGAKRKLDDDEVTEEGMNDDNDVDLKEDPCHKRAKHEDHKGVDKKCHIYKENFPLANEKGYPAIVKVYDGNLKIKLNDTIDVFGVLSMDSHLADVTSDLNDDMDCDIELRARNPLPIMVPRLHALVIKRLESDHPFHLSPILNDVKGSLRRCREQILTIFNHCFHGDELTSEYLLCHLLSGVYSRRDTAALGKFSLNISNIRPSITSVNDFYEILSQILNKCHLFPMTLENMNHLDFIPSKDYEENRLNPGLLQLSDKTHLIIDETSLQPGKLEGKGVVNMAALANVLEKQELDYNFMFHNQSYETNIRILVLSEGKSILKCDYHVPMVVLNENQSPHDLKVFLTNSILDLIRAFLCHSENIIPTLPQDVQEEIEKDFVENRKNGENKMEPEDLHASLTLVRYVALSYGLDVISLDHWKHVKEMERLRKERIK